MLILFKVPFRHNSPCRGGVGSIGWMILRTMMVVGMQERRQLIYKLSRQSNFTKFLHACSIKWKKIGRSFIISWIIYGPKSNLTSEYLITSEVHPLLVIITVDSIKKSATLSLDRSWSGLKFLRILIFCLTQKSINQSKWQLFAITKRFN